jgi:hypothetical protein
LKTIKLRRSLERVENSAKNIIEKKNMFSTMFGAKMVRRCGTKE